MKCTQCGRDNNLKDRTGNQGRCVQCNHPFAFEPTSMGTVKFTDPFFAKAIADLSANNTLFFTSKQLFYVLDQRLKRKSLGNVLTLVSLYLFSSFWALGFIGGILSTVIGSISFALVLMIVNLGWIFYLFNRSNSSQSSRATRRTSATLLQILGLVISIGGVLLGFSANSITIYGTSVLLGLAALWLGFIQKRRLNKIPETFLISAAQMENWLNQWSRINGSVTKLLPAPTGALQPATLDPDVTVYSFDRLVVCQGDEIAQMLIANNFHFEHNCAILGISGYPQSIFRTTMQMLHRNPDLQVFALHDCSPEGLQLVRQLRNSPDWFFERNVVIIDVGLLPRQIMAAKRDMVVQTSVDFAQAAQNLPSEIRQGLTAAEMSWLKAGNYVELESFSPQRLINILNRSLVKGQTIEEEDSRLILVGDGYTYGGYVYAADSFG